MSVEVAVSASVEVPADRPHRGEHGSAGAASGAAAFHRAENGNPGDVDARSSNGQAPNNRRTQAAPTRK